MFPLLAKTATSLLCSSSLSALRLLACTASEFCRCLMGKTGRKLDSIPTLLFLLESWPPHSPYQLKSQIFLPASSFVRLFPGIFYPIFPCSQKNQMLKEKQLQDVGSPPSAVPLIHGFMPSNPYCLRRSLMISHFFPLIDLFWLFLGGDVGQPQASSIMTGSRRVHV